MNAILLHRYPLLNLLSADEFHTWLDGGTEANFAAGETIFREGTIGGWAYLIKQGRVRVLRQGREAQEATVANLGSGDLFGEYALLPPHHNTATCRAVDAVRAARLPLAPLRRQLTAQPDVWRTLKRWLRLHSLAAFLQDRSCLGFMSAGTALDFLDVLQPATYEPGQTIQAAGLAADRWFFIEAGRVTLAAENGLEKISQLEAGDCFGEPALLGRQNLSLATAQTEVRCQSLSKSDFLPPDAAALPSMQTHFAGLTSPATYPWIGQEELADCGLACLAMLGNELGGLTALRELQDLVKPGENGLSLRELQQTAERIGIRAQVGQISATQWNQVELPVIALLSEGHYVVVYDVDATGIQVADPATSITTWSWHKFHEAFSGCILLAHRSNTL